MGHIDWTSFAPTYSLHIDLSVGRFCRALFFVTFRCQVKPSQYTSYFDVGWPSPRYTAAYMLQKEQTIRQNKATPPWYRKTSKATAIHHPGRTWMLTLSGSRGTNPYLPNPHQFCKLPFLSLNLLFRKVQPFLPIDPHLVNADNLPTPLKAMSETPWLQRQTALVGRY